MTGAPPHNLDAERAVLAAMLVSRDAIADVADQVSDADFYSPTHARVHRAILAVDNAGRPVDPVTVADQIAADGLQPAVTVADLADLAGPNARTDAAAHHARIVRRAAQLRRLAAIAADIRTEALQAADDPETIIDRAQTGILDLTASDDVGVIPIAQAADDWLVHLDDMVSNGGPAAGVTTGLDALDRVLCGLRPGQLVTVAGRPGAGKSMLGAQIALHVARAGGYVMLVTAEMGADEITGRLVANISGVDHDRIRSARLLDPDWPHLQRAVGILAACRLDFVDQGTITISRVRAAARRAARNGLALLVVDYLQLLAPAARRENRQVEVAEISAGLKQIARDLRVPVLALAQLNRGLENRADKRPTLADLRESGAIENDSDAVIGIYRDEMYSPDSVDKGVAELIVLKQRSGPLGTVRAHFHPATGRFANLEQAAR